MKMDIDTVIFAVVAVVLLSRLWAVLGTRYDDEPEQPNPFDRPPQEEGPDEPFAAPQAARMTAFVPPPESLEGGLAQIKALDPSFDERAFLHERRDVFSAIVGAYAAGKLTAVADFISPALLGHFQRAVDTRASAGQKAQTRIARIKDAETVAARAEGTTGFITVRFVSDQENILRDAAGAVIGGKEGKFEEVTDLWTFACDTHVPQAKWLLVETRG